MKITINNTICESIEDIQKCASIKLFEFIKEFCDNKPYVEAHTSGSTGTPKVIHLLKEDMRQSARLTNNFFKLNSDSLFYLNLSPDYIAGKMMIVRTLELGASIIEEEPSNQPLANYYGKPIDLASFVPSQLGYLINNPDKQTLIKTMIVGGGKISERIEKYIADIGINAYATYGMTETCSHVALAPITGYKEPFTALGNVTFTTDERGCLIIDAPQFSCNKIITNDIVELLSYTQFRWCGRYDNVINSGGVKIFPEDIERKIEHLLPHTRFFITSQPSEKWNEEVILVFEYKNLPEGVLKRGAIHSELIEKMKQILPPHAIPRSYVATSHFKETDSGKIIRKIQQT